MSKRVRKPTQKALAPVVTSLQPPPPTQKRGNVELFMECVDEDLAPSQKEAERIAETEYQSAVQRVQSAKSAVSPRSSDPEAVTGSVGRGRPRKDGAARNVTTASTAVSRGRGRPRKDGTPRNLTTASTAAANDNVARGSSRRARGRGSEMTIARGVPGKLTRCT